MTKLTLHHVARAPRKPSGELSPVIVLLHGVGSNEEDLLGLAPALDPRFYVISVRAPNVLGAGSFGWYHVEFTPTGFIMDEAEAAVSRDLVVKFVHELKDAYPIDDRQIYLMGFSQGCIMSLGAALTHPQLFAGIAGMSGRLLDSMMTDMAPSTELQGLPLIVTHGTRDGVITIDYGREIRDKLAKLPVALTYHEYPMAHNVSEESMKDVSAWLTARLDATSDWRSPGA